jgi:hypothetical protein
MNTVSRDKVLYLRLRRPVATYCQDCDPEGARPFHVEVRADPRTGDILTPCPACARHALATVRRTSTHRNLGG